MQAFCVKTTLKTNKCVQILLDELNRILIKEFIVFKSMTRYFVQHSYLIFTNFCEISGSKLKQIYKTEKYKYTKIFINCNIDQI